MKTELIGKSLENVHKVVFLANEYPGKTMKEITDLFQMSPLHINTAIWRAQDMGFITVNDDGKFTIDKIPEQWQLGEDTEFLMETITYIFKRLAIDEMDLEDNIFGHWSAGSPTHDVMIAVKKLIRDKVLMDYEIKDVVIVKKATRTRREVTRESIYTFYTLYENMEMRWGEKQFKKNAELK